MNSTVLLKKLIAIEKSIGTASNSTIRNLVQEAQDCLLQMQKERAEKCLAESWREATAPIALFHKAS